MFMARIRGAVMPASKLGWSISPWLSLEPCFATSQRRCCAQYLAKPLLRTIFVVPYGTACFKSRGLANGHIAVLATLGNIINGIALASEPPEVSPTP